VSELNFFVGEVSGGLINAALGEARLGSGGPIDMLLDELDREKGTRKD